MTAKPISVVAVMAHPDDIEIHIAGTLCLLRDRGCAVTFVTVCDGDVGSMIHSREETARIRRAESEGAARLFGASFVGLGWGDLRVTYELDLKGRIVTALRRFGADIVITHAPVDYMADHEFTSMLTREACFAAPARNWPADPRFDPLDHIPELYYADPTSLTDMNGSLVPAPVIVDVSGVMEQKEAMLACHDSQRAWLRAQHGEDNYILSMREWGRIRGAQAGFDFGEGLRQHLGHPFPKGSRLFDLLRDVIRRF